MSTKQFNTRIQHKIDTYDHWELAVNFRPLDGEIIIFTPDPKNPEDTRPVRLKIGSGNKLLSELDFVAGGLSAGDSSQSDWNQTDIYSPDYIKNKPEITSEISQDNNSLVTSGAVYDAMLKTAQVQFITWEAND